ncbi:MAG: acyl-CoA-binding protein [Schleiferiaceae bacterium]|jgi:acyl-CoA-binding protein|nr:acyl-CoA-binding protein [Schleiferiaceae bacterium]
MANSELENEFWDYVKAGRDMPKQAPDTMLFAYGYYKQATEGDVKGERPDSSSEVVNAFKYDQWTRMKGMTKEEAMKNYINFIRKLFKEQGLRIEAYLKAS